MMDIVENDLLRPMGNVTFIRLDGSVPSNDRMGLVNRCQANITFLFVFDAPTEGFVFGKHFFISTVKHNDK